MCGIVGAVDLHGKRVFPLPVLRAMAQAIVHRGPDGYGECHEPGVALATQRLAIRDPQTGHQPLADAASPVWVSFNGELFDFPEMLAHPSRAPVGTCDTQAWVPLYERHGTSVFEHARGQFAVALWDRKQRRLLLGRDRHGICPLYYAEVDGWLLWASEVKGLLASGLIEPRPDLKAVDHLFSFFCAPARRTFFEGIHLLAPGQMLDVAAGRYEEKAYWDLDFPDAGDERRVEDPAPLVDELHGLLDDAVRRRLRADAPLTSYLSGGVDSSLVLAMACRARGEPLPAFTIGFDGAGPDERTLAASFAGSLGAPLERVILDRADLMNAFPDLAVATEGPLFDQSNAGLMLLARRVAAAGYSVALTGEGADETLAGYIWYRGQRVLDLLSRYSFGAVPRLTRWLTTLLVGGASRSPALRPMRGHRIAQQHTYDALSQTRAEIYAESMWQRLGDHDPYSDLDLPSERMSRWDPLNRSLYVDSKLMLPGLLLLAKGDRVSMSAAVEARYPYLDEAVTSFCAEIAPEYKLRGLREKWLLRRVAARMLPANVAGRRKSMYRAYPLFTGNGQPAWVGQLLSDESLRATGYFDPGAIRRQVGGSRLSRSLSVRSYLLDACMTGVVSTQLWHHLFFGGGLCELPVWTAAEVPQRSTSQAS